ncbi:pyridoxal phosphate-dependent aminotransferase [Thermogymnomonas acidicola]|uniref:pyridoxal phosphate-dependent aminotransferase n=1 Tax=Thermogymnomonas acidicola TaxID=399579 RepID=UPI0009463336|nr:pyridoxal phosphate-dependent aminotransferase [Thermogymnomonas acidicola]
MLSRRISSVRGSATISLSNRASLMERQGKRVLNFGVGGEPDFTTPEGIIEGAFQWARKGGKTHYTPSAGIFELREAIAQDYVERGGFDVKPENILVTPTKFAINLAVFSTMDPGDEILIPEPYYLSYYDIAAINGIKPVPVRTGEDFSFDFDLMQEYVGPRTRGVIISNPSNPTGRVYGRDEIKGGLVDFCEDNGMLLLSDEIYRSLVYEGQPASPPLSFTGLDRAIVMDGFSKSYAMTGWRIGYLVADRQVIEGGANRLQQQTITCAPPSVAQYAALEALKDKQSPVEMRERFRKRRDLVLRELGKSSRLKIVKPQGAFYVFPEFSDARSSEKFCEDLLEEKGVIVTPGSAFGEQGGEKHFRLSFATSESVIEEGCRMIVDFLEGS